jgi:hypothetical protein
MYQKCFLSFGGDSLPDSSPWNIFVVFVFGVIHHGGVLLVDKGLVGDGRGKLKLKS